MLCFSWLNQYCWNNQSPSGSCECIWGIFFSYCLKYHTVHFELLFCQAWALNPDPTPQEKDLTKDALSSLMPCCSAAHLFLPILSTALFTWHLVPKIISATYEEWCGVKLELSPNEVCFTSVMPWWQKAKLSFRNVETEKWFKWFSALWVYDKD